jgi:hypothetical protein
MWEGITSTTFAGILDEVKAGLPIIIPVVIGFLAIRKGWSFVKGELAGA